MTTITVPFPNDTINSFPGGAKELKKEMRLAAAVRLYALRKGTQERAAELAGLSRAEFITALGRFAALQRR